MKMNVTLNKFSSKSDEGIFIGYSHNSKCYRVLNKWTRWIEEHANISFDKHHVKSSSVWFPRPSLFPNPPVEFVPCVTVENDFDDFFDVPVTAIDSEAYAPDNVVSQPSITVSNPIEKAQAATPQSTSPIAKPCVPTPTQVQTEVISESNLYKEDEEQLGPFGERGPIFEGDQPV